MIKNIAAIAFTCLLAMSGQMLLKKGLGQIGGFHVRSLFESTLKLTSNPYVLASIGCYAVAFTLYLAILSRNQLSSLYPIAVGLNFVILGAASPFFLNEPMTLAKAFGIALILTGISCFALSKSSL